MTTQTAKVAVPNATLLLMGADGQGDVPEFIDELSFVAATETALAINTRHLIDGETVVHLTGPIDLNSVNSQASFVWRGLLRVNGEISIELVDKSPILKATANQITSLVIWANDLREPDEVWIYFG